MSLLDLLGLGAPNASNDPSGLFSFSFGNGSPAMGAQPDQQPQGLRAFLGDPQSQAPAYQPVQRPHGLHGILDSIGDALLVANGAEPIHRQHFQQEQQRQALSGFLTNPDQAIQQLMQIDPKSGIELWRSAHPPSEKTMEQKVYEYEQGLPPEQRPAFERSIQLTHPGMGTPLTVEAGTIGPDGRPIGIPANVPTVATQADYDRLPLGSPYRDAQGRIGTKGGATASNPSATFPGR